MKKKANTIKGIAQKVPIVFTKRTNMIKRLNSLKKIMKAVKARSTEDIVTKIHMKK